jgi:Fe-S oxidoreductase
VAQIIRALRLLAWNAQTVQEGLPSLLWSIYWNNNPWSQPPSHRENWIGGFEIPLFDPDQHEILLYIGCTSSYDRRAQRIALSLVKVFQASGVRYGYLGEDEPCCGESALSVGHLPYFHEIVSYTAKLFHDRGVTAVVTVSPHCYDVFKNHYPDIHQPIKPIHYTQYIEKLISDGRLSFSTRIRKRVTYQDPCYLGRHNKVYDAPRAVINAIPGIELVEMTESGIDGLCCGGGGGRMWLETKAGERFSDSRVQQALETNADTLITACPFCVVCLEDSMKSIPGCEMQILDVAELVVQAF